MESERLIQYRRAFEQDAKAAAINYYAPEIIPILPDHVSGGENPRIDGDVAGCEWSAFCGESAVVLATVKDARRRFAVAFGHP